MAGMSNAAAGLRSAVSIINPPGTAMMFYASTRYRSREAAIAGEVDHDLFVPDHQRVALYRRLCAAGLWRIGAGAARCRRDRRHVDGLEAPERKGGPDRPAQSPGGGDLRASAFYPLTIPLTGPGTIAVTIALGAGRPQDPAVVGWFVIGALLATIAIAALIYVCYRFADRVETAIGATASDAIARLFAFILMCIGIQIGWAGISELLVGLRER
jgi:multiple antibiotic resistance protein